ncbi:MAG: hypothetical protein UU09_C0014G0007 [Microgenomates group bacterium GW2011_GWA2_40_6]|nr:MAG: hypothetical protein UU09_C0014G0007 [Microgenomates group bacterium GW2011_GWA2_40_6]
MDPKELERLIHRDKKLRTKENGLILFDHYAAISATLSPKEKYRLAPKINSFIIQAFKSGPNNLADLEKFLDLLKKFPGSPRDLSQVIGQYYTLKGGEPKTLVTKLGTISVEGGTISVSDTAFQNRYINSSSAEFDRFIIEDMQQGKIFHFSTGGDGTYDIILRCVDGPEPVANPKEYRFLLESSPTYIIAIPSGKVVVSDFGHDLPHSPLQLDVAPGNYKVASHHKEISDKFYGYVIVLCKTDLPATNLSSGIVTVE